MTASAARITTTDLLKIAGLALVLVDHYGLFFAPGEPSWRVFGRGAAPIFFFLVGYARTRAVPASWLVLGVILTATDFALSPTLDDVSINILFNLALIRIVFGRADGLQAPSSWVYAAVAAVLALLMPLAGNIIEYGLGGWLWAILGLAVRNPGDNSRGAILVIAAVSVTAYGVREVGDFNFRGDEIPTLFALLALCAVAFVTFQRRDLPLSLPAAVVGVINWTGRRSLEIYALTLLLMQAGAWWLGR